MSSPFLANWLLLLHLLPELPLGPARACSQASHQEGVRYSSLPPFSTFRVSPSTFTLGSYISLQSWFTLLYSRGRQVISSRSGHSPPPSYLGIDTVLHSGRNRLSKCKSDLITALKCLKSTWVRYTMLICTWPLLTSEAFPIRILLSLCFAPHCPIAHVTSTHCLAQMPVHALYSLHLGPPPSFPGGLPCIFQDN